MDSIASNSSLAPVPVDLHELLVLAVRGLVKMYDPDRKLFCSRLNLTDNGLVREGYSQRYTVISLLGLRQLERAGLNSPIDVKDALDTLLRDRTWIACAGDLGLLLWLCAETTPENLERICYSPDLKMALDHFPDAHSGRTRELSWFLSGLAHTVLARQEERFDLTDLTVKVFRLIRRNQGKSGLFGHSASRRTFAWLTGNGIGSFEDQVYPIYALVRLAQAYAYEEPLAMAEKCAIAICTLQGPMGQWWPHYDSHSGKVVHRYPVSSLNQCGLAPMALLALTQVTTKDFSESIYRGVQWITGRNELNCDLRDADASALWRGIYEKTSLLRYIMDPLAFWDKSSVARPLKALSLMMEFRPHHLGWLLYTFAPQLAVPPSSLGEVRNPSLRLQTDKGTS